MLIIFARDGFVILIIPGIYQYSFPM